MFRYARGCGTWRGEAENQPAEVEAKAEAEAEAVVGDGRAGEVRWGRGGGRKRRCGVGGAWLGHPAPDAAPAPGGPVWHVTSGGLRRGLGVGRCTGTAGWAAPAGGGAQSCSTRTNTVSGGGRPGTAAVLRV